MIRNKEKASKISSKNGNSRWKITRKARISVVWRKYFEFIELKSGRKG